MSRTGDPGDHPVDRGDVAEAGHILRRHFYRRRSGGRREEEARLSGVVALASIMVPFAYPATTFRSSRGLIGRIELRLLDLGCIGWGRVERRRKVRRCLLAHD